jgi:hypothetical protein
LGGEMVMSARKSKKVSLLFFVYYGCYFKEGVGLLL